MKTYVKVTLSKLTGYTYIWEYMLCTQEQLTNKEVTDLKESRERYMREYEGRNFVNLAAKNIKVKTKTNKN